MCQVRFEVLKYTLLNLTLFHLSLTTQVQDIYILQKFPLKLLFGQLLPQNVLVQHCSKLTWHCFINLFYFVFTCTQASSLGIVWEHACPSFHHILMCETPLS